MGVRPAVIDDAEAIAALHIRSWQVGYRGLLSDGLLDSLQPARRIPSSGVTRPGLLVPSR